MAGSYASSNVFIKLLAGDRGKFHLLYNEIKNPQVYPCRF